MSFGIDCVNGKSPTFFCVSCYFNLNLGYLNQVQAWNYLTQSEVYDYDYRFNKPQQRNKRLNQAVQCEQANFVVSHSNSHLPSRLPSEAEANFVYVNE